MSFDRAIILAVDRPSAKVKVTEGGGAEPDIVAYSTLPWPLAKGDMEQVASGDWICRGGIGDARLRMHDDFDNFIDLSPGVVGQTGWDMVGNAVLLSQQPAGYGTLRLTTDGTTNHHFGIRKDPVNFGTRYGRWLEARVSVPTLTNCNWKVGFVDQSASLWSTTDELAAVGQASVNGGAIQLVAKSGGVSAPTVDTGFVPTAGTAFYIQLFVAGSDFAGIWIAQEGNADDETTISDPLFATSNIPAGLVGPGASVQQTSTGAVSLDLDFIDVWSVFPFATPDDVLKLT